MESSVTAGLDREEDVLAELEAQSVNKRDDFEGEVRETELNLQGWRGLTEEEEEEVCLGFWARIGADRCEKCADFILLSKLIRCSASDLSSRHFG